VLLSDAAMQCLVDYAWPGNVRELGNLIERLSILCAGRPVTAADLPPRYRPAGWTPPAEPENVPVAPAPAASAAVAVVEDDPEDDADVRLSEREALLVLEEPAASGGIVLPPGGIDLRAHVAAIEESLIRQALERGDGVVAQAARLLGLRRTTLVEKLRKFGISGVDEATAD
jgi:sigma-54 specific flagellar transcriptional regulator A